jgi:hypothetical protein
VLLEAVRAVELTGSQSVQLLTLLLLDVLVKNSGDAFLKEASNNKSLVDDLGHLCRMVPISNSASYDKRVEPFYADDQQCCPFDDIETAAELGFCIRDQATSRFVRDGRTLPLAEDPGFTLSLQGSFGDSGNDR